MNTASQTGTASIQVINLLGRQALVLGLALVANVIAARALLPAGRGALAFGLQVAFVVSFVVVMGLDKSLAIVSPGRSLTSSLPGLWRQARPRAALVLLAGVAATAIGAASSLLDAGFVDDRASTVLLYGLPVAAMALGSAMNRLFEAGSVNANRAQLTLLDAFATGAITLSGVALLALTDIDQPALWLSVYGVSAGSIGLILANRFGLVSRRSLDPKAAPPISHDEANALRRAGRTLFPASMASYAALRSDRIILPILDGTESLGLYVVVATFTDLAATPVEALANVLTPRWRRAHLAGQLRTRSTILAVVVMLVVAAIGAVVVGRFALVPIFGDAYEPAIRLLPALAVGSGVFGLGRLVAARRLAEGHIRLVSTADVAGMVSSVASYLALIPIFGTMGAAVGSIVGYSVSLVLLMLGTRWFSTEPSSPVSEPTPTATEVSPTSDTNVRRVGY